MTVSTAFNEFSKTPKELGQELLAELRKQEDDCDIDQVIYLVKAGARLTEKNDMGRTVVETAAFNGHEKCLEILIDAGAKPTRQALVNAIMAKSPRCVNTLISAGVRVNTKDKDGDTLLNYAVHCENTECVSIFLKAGLKVNHANKDGKTALHFAAIGFNTEAVQLLIDAGAHINAKDNEGHTPLMDAAMSGKTECVKALVSAGASINERNNKGDTARVLATKRHNDAVVEALKEAANNCARGLVAPVKAPRPLVLKQP
jgi:ankyrin repeat protein